MGSSTVLQNYIDGQWCLSTATEVLDVLNPATTESLARVPLSSTAEVERAILAADRAFVSWRRTPASDRIQFLFKLKFLLEEHLDDLAQTITLECGKTLAESKGELRRAIENVEVACGIPTLMQGCASEDIARDIDEYMIRQPLGVVGIICPFNFPGMIPFWFMPYAIA
jgi:malonate-semialdehyde dehydrogenase (acetylating)/methylmalonate-semialdehyde dehydrogenase